MRTTIVRTRRRTGWQVGREEDGTLVWCHPHRDSREAMTEDEEAIVLLAESWWQGQGLPWGSY